MRKKVLMKRLIEILNRRMIAVQDQERKALTFEISSRTAKKDYGTSHSPSLDSKKEMNRDLKQAYFELQYAMLLASNEMKAEEWLSGANEDYTNGFWTGWMFCEDSRNISEICKEIFGKD